MERILSSNSNGASFEVLSNPEFLAEGSAVRDLEEPDRVLIGSRNTEKALKARDELMEIYENWVPREKIIPTNIWSAELSKLVANLFLAQRIATINAVSAVCEKTEAKVSEVSTIVGMDQRIGGKYLQASVGFGGSCFKKDILNLVYLCGQYGLPEVAGYLESVVRINEYQKERFVRNILTAMFDTLAGKKICLFGFAFKANTGDTRESPAIYIAKRLLDEHAKLVISDPQALDNARKDLAGLSGSIEFIADPYEAVRECHAIAVLTEWEIYKTLNYRKIHKVMAKPAFIFDGRNLLNHKKCHEYGFNVYPIGQPPFVHFK